MIKILSGELIGLNRDLTPLSSLMKTRKRLPSLQSRLFNSLEK